MSVSCVVSTGAANGYRERVDSSGVLLQETTAATTAEAAVATYIVAVLSEDRKDLLYISVQDSGYTLYQ